MADPVVKIVRTVIVFILSCLSFMSFRQLFSGDFVTPPLELEPTSATPPNTFLRIYEILKGVTLAFLIIIILFSFRSGSARTAAEENYERNRQWRFQAEHERIRKEWEWFHFQEELLQRERNRRESEAGSGSASGSRGHYSVRGREPSPRKLQRSLELLGVISSSALDLDKDTISRAYRERIVLYHPDKSPDKSPSVLDELTRKSQELTEARDFLMNLS